LKIALGILSSFVHLVKLIDTFRDLTDTPLVDEIAQLIRLAQLQDGIPATSEVLILIQLKSLTTQFKFGNLFN